MTDARADGSDEEPETASSGHGGSTPADDAASIAPDRDGAPSSARAAPSSPDREPVLGSIADRLRTDPSLWVPFLVAGTLLLAVDLLRERDSLPTASGVRESTIHVSYSMYPSGTTVTDRTLDALVDLQPSVLGYALGLEIVAVAAVAVAGWLTMVRASGESLQPKRFLVYAGGVALVDLLSRSSDAVGLEYTGGRVLIGLAILALAMLVFVRLFLVPITLLRDGGIAGPIGSSWRYSRGNGVTLFGVIVIVGIGSWTLAHVPTIGTLLSTAVAGTVHAVSLVVLYDRCAGE